ncbi:Sec-independent protein translocase protein TatA [Gammaproteobacteria bacterium]
MSGAFSFWHLLIILTIVILLFGTQRLGNLGADLGNAIKGFRNAMKDGEQAASEEKSTNHHEVAGSAQAAPGHTLEGEVTARSKERV